MRSRFLLLATLILLTAATLRLIALHDYPPGPHYDEAVYLIVSRSIAFGGARFFPMVEAYQGREVLYMYLNAPFLQFIHDDIFTLHMVSVFCNLITVAASMALGRLMFRGQRGWMIGLSIGVLIALSFPQIWLARQAFRAVTLPMMQAVALAFLWRGLTVKRRDWFWLIVGGFLAGAAVYTYNSSRLFPLWLGIAGLALLIVDRAHWRLRLRQGAIFFGVLIVTATPMAIYAVQRPDIFFGRLAEVTQSGQSITLLESIWLHIKMFFIDGDPYLRYNLPHRPYFTLPEGLLLVIGLIVSARRLFGRGDPLERTAYLLALLSPLMVIPSVISVGGLPPSHMRSLGMIPLIFVAVAVGVEWVYMKITPLIPRPLLPRKRGQEEFQVPSPRLRGRRDANRRLDGVRGVASLVIAVLLIGGVLVGQTYFGWATRADVYYETDADLSAAARWLADHHGDEIVYVAARDKGHPTAMIEPIPPVTWLGTDLLFLPPPGKTGLYVFPRSAPPPDAWRALLERGAITDLPLAPDGRTAFEAFRLTDPANLESYVPVPAENDYLTLIGVNAPEIAAGAAGMIQIAWRVKAPPPVGDFTSLFQLEDSSGNVLSRTEPYMTLTDAWRAGETLIQQVSISAPAATPPGVYALRVAWVGRASDQYAPYVSVNGLAGVWAQVGTVTVTRPAVLPDSTLLPITMRANIQAGNDLRGIGYDLADRPYRPGESIPLTIYWQSEAAGEHATILTAQLDDVLLEAWTPLAGYSWLVGETLAERHRLEVPRELPTGTYTLRLNGVELGMIRVHGIARSFDLPPMDHRVNVLFGDQIELVGYSLAIEETGFVITFNWLSTSIITIDFKFFIHLIDNSGTILRQIDNMPRANTYPTSLWAAGEVVTEIHHLPRLPEGYALRVGIYDPQTMVRLPIEGVENRDFFEMTFDQLMEF